jgi:hypothetical protein
MRAVFGREGEGEGEGEMCVCVCACSIECEKTTLSLELRAGTNGDPRMPFDRAGIYDHRIRIPNLGTSKSPPLTLSQTPSAPRVTLSYCVNAWFSLVDSSLSSGKRRRQKAPHGTDLRASIGDCDFSLTKTRTRHVSRRDAMMTHMMYNFSTVFGS